MKTSHLLACLTVLTVSAVSQAALLLQSDQASYQVSSNGSTVTTVSVFLVQTAPTTVLADHDGLNSFQIQVAPTSSLNAPTLSAVHVNSAFTGNSVQMPSTGTLGGSFLNYTSGVPLSGGKILLGTFDFTGSATTASTTYNITTPTLAGYDYTAATNSNGSDAVDIGSQITAGSFQVSVPEPASLATIGIATVAVMRRRRV